MRVGLLPACLAEVVGLAKKLSPATEAANAPQTVVGIVIATPVLLPQTWAAVRAARATRLQSSMNPVIGSAPAGIGLTVPVVVPASIDFDLPLVLGWEPKDIAMPALTFAVSAITLGTGRTIACCVINASGESVAQTFLSVREPAQTGMSVPPMHWSRSCQ